MRTIINISILSFFLLSAGLAYGQKASKIGHINSNDLLDVMPEKDTAEKALETYVAELQKQAQLMTTEYQTKITEFQNLPELTDEFVRKSKEQDILDLQKRIQDFEGNAQQAIAKKEAEIMEPIIKKAKDAIQAVAKEHGYSYVFDSGIGTMLYYPEGDDILPLVKTKMGITK